MLAKDISFVREAIEAPYGTVAVFEDLYGNLLFLLWLNELRQSAYDQLHLADGMATIPNLLLPQHHASKQDNPPQTGLPRYLLCQHSMRHSYLRN